MKWERRQLVKPQPCTPALQKQASKQGFTMLEVLVALSILSVGLLALHQAFRQVLVVHDTVQQTWQAATFIEREFTRYRRLEQPFPVGLAQGTYPEDHPLAGYRWKRRVKKREIVPGITMLNVELELKWQIGGVTRSYTGQMLQSP